MDILDYKYCFILKLRRLLKEEVLAVFGCYPFSGTNWGVGDFKIYGCSQILGRFYPNSTVQKINKSFYYRKAKSEASVRIRVVCLSKWFIECLKLAVNYSWSAILHQEMKHGVVCFLATQLNIPLGCELNRVVYQLCENIPNEVSIRKDVKINLFVNEGLNGNMILIKYSKFI